MKRVMIRMGDVFAVKLDDKRKKFFQYVGDDVTQLNSRVIRAFKKAYPLDEVPNVREIVRVEIDFYAHVVIRWGLQMGLWEKVGNVKEVGEIDVFFRGSWDYGNPEIKKSQRWYIWRVNEPFRELGKLPLEYRSAEIGVVVAPPDVVDRMRTGRYHFVYPEY